MENAKMNLKRVGLGVYVAGCVCLPATAANVLIWGNNSNAAVASFLQSSGHTVTDIGSSLPTPGDLAGNEIAIGLRTTGNADVISWVNGGGCLITEWTTADWALSTANLLDADVSGGGLVGTGTPVTVTAAGISAGLDTGLSANPYSAGPASQFFRDFINIGAGVSVMATRPTNVPAILGGASGSGLVLANGIDWADSFGSTGADNEQFLLNSVEGFCSGAVAPPPPGPSGPQAIPVLSTIGLAIMSALMGIAGIFGIRRFRSIHK